MDLDSYQGPHPEICYSWGTCSGLHSRWEFKVCGSGCKLVQGQRLVFLTAKLQSTEQKWHHAAVYLLAPYRPTQPRLWVDLRLAFCLDADHQGNVTQGCPKRVYLKLNRQEGRATKKDGHHQQTKFKYQHTVSKPIRYVTASCRIWILLEAKNGAI